MDILEAKLLMNGDDIQEALKLADEYSRDVLFAAFILRGTVRDMEKLNEIYPYECGLVKNVWEQDLVEKYKGVGL